MTPAKTSARPPAGPDTRVLSSPVVPRPGGPRGLKAKTQGAQMTPQEFAAQLKRLAATRPAAEVVAFYDRHGATIQPLLKGRDRVTVADIMEVADTVVEYDSAAQVQGQPQARRHML